MTDFKDEEELRDIEYGVDEFGKSSFDALTYDDVDGYPIEISNEKTDEIIEEIKNESQTTEENIVKDINAADYLSKKEKNLFRRVISKRINQVIKKYKKEVESTTSEIGILDIDYIRSELDEELDTIRDSVNEMLDIDEYGYGHQNCCVQTNVNSYSKNWSNSPVVSAESRKDYSSGMKEIDSDKKIKVKIDKESLDAFLSESDGDNENIGMITSDNREFYDIENVIFKIVKIENNIKKRQGAYTEADGKAISDYAQNHDIVKCGWIHTHPFTRNSTHFSGLDNTTTKEMCVLPDDYCLAVVVGCEYKEVNNYMKDDGKIVKEFDLFYNLGRVTYRKVQLITEEYNKKTDSINKKPSFAMVKYECDIVTVDKDGNIVEEI